ncbi:hypothetical protein C483_02181 [Natrialba hulunbeirensis JCM 10989]|uniref:Uncharacterized protein n=1 Tax=Natrialba hulunbeirensis JCM 10989 TaxID=1227493 RepID=M0A9D2_9EURY|nr:hypothetical protein C483_02181 [Natrialba hulunbeirensis JCM 10989]
MLLSGFIRTLCNIIALKAQIEIFLNIAIRFRNVAESPKFCCKCPEVVLSKCCSVFAYLVETSLPAYRAGTRKVLEGFDIPKFLATETRNEIIPISCTTDERRGVKTINTEIEKKWLVDKTTESVHMKVFVG